MQNDQYIVAIEIGSSKIVGAVATKSDTGAVSVIALEEEKIVDCIRYGCVQNVEEVYIRVNRILKKLENRQYVAPRKIKSLYVGMSGRSIRSIRHRAEISLQENTPITNDHIRLLRKNISHERFEGLEVLGVVPYLFRVDGIEVKRPVGMIGTNLTGEFNIIVGRPILKANLRRVLEERLSLKVREYAIIPLEVAKEVLTEEELQLGCMLVDFGAETTTVSIYKNNVLQYLSTIPIGSRTITRDLTTLNILEDRAEDVKKSVGNAIPENISTQSKMEDINVSDLLNYITARAGEIKENIMSQLEYANLTYSDIPGGIILVGGGAKLRNFDELLATSTKLKVRKGTHEPAINILDPRVQGMEYVQIVSLLDCGASHIGQNESCCESPVIQQPIPEDNRQYNNNRPAREPERPKKPKAPSKFRNIINTFRDRTSALFNGDNEDDDYYKN